jgi:hypothetical protein
VRRRCDTVSGRRVGRAAAKGTVVAEQGEAVEVPAAEPALEPVALPEAVPEAPGRSGPLLGGGRAAAPRAAGGREDIVDRLARADVRTCAGALASLQRGAGNRVLARRLGAAAAAALLQREDGAPRDAEAPDAEPSPEELSLDGAGYLLMQTGGGGPGAGAAPGAGGARPPLKSIRHDCADCDEAVAILNAGNYVGEANVQLKPAAGTIQVSGAGSAFTAEVEMSWPIDPAASTMDVTDFVWPTMTDAAVDPPRPPRRISRRARRVSSHRRGTRNGGCVCPRKSGPLSVAAS